MCDNILEYHQYLINFMRAHGRKRRNNFARIKMEFVIDVAPHFWNLMIPYGYRRGKRFDVFYIIVSLRVFSDKNLRVLFVSFEKKSETRVESGIYCCWRRLFFPPFVTCNRGEIGELRFK